MKPTSRCPTYSRTCRTAPSSPGGSLQRILVESRRLDDFKRNPQQFIEQIAEAINRCKRLAVVDGIKYQRLGDASYYAQELFEQEELTGYLKNMLGADKAVYEKRGLRFDRRT